MPADKLIVLILFLSIELSSFIAGEIIVAANNVVVVGIPDKERGTIVNAFIKPEADLDSSEALVSELSAFIKEREAAYKYPREIEFLDEFPTMVSGKVQCHKLTE